MFKIRITRMSKASWFKIKFGRTVIHFDPGYTGYFKNQGIPSAEVEEKADIILISHQHKDHLQPEALALIAGEATKIIAPLSCFDEIRYMYTIIEPNESVAIGRIKVTSVDAYNTRSGHSTRKVHHKGKAVGYLVDIGYRRIYFAGDTDLIPEMRKLGKVDIAFLPIGGTFVMDIDEAVQAVRIIKPSIAIPMHQSKNDQQEFLEKVCLDSDSKALIVGVGETVEV
jgi:L-ascorbate metabolism protein UlaG (beta-lactamase superfamily)